MSNQPPIDRQKLMEKLEILREFHCSQSNYIAADAILDVMNIVTGWCSPRMKV